MNYKISVIIPTFNRALIIKDALNSVLEQTYTNWECLIVDDGSTDDSEEVIRDFIKEDERFLFIKRPEFRRKGAASCRNIGLENATGDFIQFLDSDDCMAPNKFEVQLKALLRSRDPAIATCKFSIQKPTWSHPRVYENLSTYRSFNKPIELFTCFAKNFTYFPPHIYLSPRAVIQKAGKWNEALRVNDDGEFFSRVILNCSAILFCKETSAIYKTGAEHRVTGELTQHSGLENYVKCWEATDLNIFEKTGIKNHIYIKAAKRNFYNRLLRQNPDLVDKFEDFLNDKWAFAPYFIYLLRNRTKHFIFRT